MTRTKICCIGSVAEAGLAVRHGASAIGLVSEMPSGPGVIPETLIREIAATVPPAVGSVLLTSSVSSADIIAQQKRCRVNTLQICDRIDPGNVGDAIRMVRPFGVDVCSGVRTAGELDEDKLVEFIDQVRAAV